jgi:hypothetical protein
MFRSLVSLALAALVGAVLVLAAVWLVWRAGAGWFQTETRTESRTIVEQIRMIAKLQTVEYHGSNTVKLEKEDWKGKNAAIYLLEGTVVATVDLERMTFEVSGAGPERTVRIKLPPVVVEDPMVDRFEIMMSCASFLTAPKLADEDRNTLHREALIGLKAAANKFGIRDRAVRQAQDYLTTFLAALGYKVVFT